MNIRQISEGDEDYTVVLDDENGNTIKVYIPIDKECWNKTPTYGLNFISGGHYR